MTQVRKPGSNGKVASVLFFFYLITRTVSHHVLKILPITEAGRGGGGRNG